jgi:hypothetical protein
MDAAECRTRALACRLLADILMLPEQREVLLKIAMTWDKLASEKTLPPRGEMHRT